MTVTAPIGEGSGDSFVRQKGRAFILSLYSVLRATKLYPIGHASVQKALEDLVGVTRAIHSSEHDLELRVSGEFIFVNGTRLRLDLDNYASFSHVLSIFRVCGVGTLHVSETAAARDWQVLVSLLQAGGDASPHDRLYGVIEKLEAAAIVAFTLSEPAEDSGEDRERSKERAKRTYAQDRKSVV